MNKLDKILIANDDLKGMDAAISKAEILEHFSGTEVEVAQVVWDAIEEEEDLETDEREQLVVAFTAAERAALAAIMKSHRSKMASIKERVLWNRRSADAILNEIDTHKPDLLIKPIGKFGLTSLIHTPLDWQLLREAQCPVLLSKSISWNTGGNVLAALDTRQEHAAVNKEIISTAVFFAQALDADIHLVTAAPAPTHTLSSNLVNRMLQKRKAKLEAIANSSKRDDINVHAVLGEPATVIANKANELSATVIVLGTHAHTGFKKLLLGNTAEKILTQIDCDTITIRPTDAKN